MLRTGLVSMAMLTFHLLLVRKLLLDGEKLRMLRKLRRIKLKQFLLSRKIRSNCRPSMILSRKLRNKGKAPWSSKKDFSSLNM